MAANTLTYSGATTVVFPLPQSAGYSVATVRQQPRDWSRGGTLYLYDRGIGATRHTLIYNRLGAAALDNLYLFFDSYVRGSSRPFTWYDQTNTPHTVRLVGGISTVEIHPDVYRVSLTLEEMA